MERARLTAALFGAIVVPLVVIAFYRPAAAPPAPPPTPVQPSAVAKPTPKEAQPPTRTVACLAPDVTLVADGENVVICYPSGVCTDEQGARTERPAAPPASSLHVEATRACTGTACDPLGPKLQRAVADADGDALQVSPDHSLVMVGDAVWNRARDRVIAPPPARTHGWDHEGDVLGSVLLGTHVLVAREWWPDQLPPPPWMPARGTILDANGRTVASIAVGHDLEASTFALGHDAFLVFDGKGGFSLVVAGVPTWFGTLVTWTGQRLNDRIDEDPGLGSFGFEAQVNAVVLAGQPELEVTTLEGEPTARESIERVAAEWCDEGGCHISHLEISFQTAIHGGKRSAYVSRTADNVFPQCD